MTKKKIIIVGAGPGGLAAGMILAHRGFDVKIFEKNSIPGGRNASIELNGYKFDIGPTFFMMKKILDKVFEMTKRKPEDYIDFQKLSPMYRLYFPNKKTFDVFEDKIKMQKEIERVFGEKEKKGLEKFYKKEKIRLEKLYPILEKDNNSLFDIFSGDFFKLLPKLSFGKSLFQVMGQYFDEEFLKLSFTFQAKYLGMSPWACPGAFAMVPFVEHSQGIYHIKGGLSETAVAMAKIITEEKGEIFYNTKVEKLIIENKKVIGVKLTNGEKIKADDVIINADFGYAMTKLVGNENLKKYNAEKLKNKKLSCSIFMIYLGVKKQYKLPHHNIIFADNYRKNVKDIFDGTLSENDFSFYVRDLSTTDPKTAPSGKSALYVLIPVPNTRAKINWKTKKSVIRNKAIELLKSKLNLSDIEDQIETELIITPNEWEKDYNVYKGAVFNLAHNLGQMLWLRPHNKFEELDNCYLVGDGTHPGSGLPTIYQSGIIVADLITKEPK